MQHSVFCLAVPVDSCETSSKKPEYAVAVLAEGVIFSSKILPISAICRALSGT